jgi:3-dehydroquinate synthase
VAERIHVSAPGGDYDIVIEPGLLSQTERLVQEFGLGSRVVIVTNTALARLYGDRLAEALPNAALVTMPDGERFKTLDTVEQLYRDFVEAGLDRSGTVVVLGGGVVGDTAGFAAATYMRGVRLVQIPTSLLAMVDSSVGGKVGVDLPEGKNLVGAFKQPDAVLIDPDVLRTLPEREWKCGMAEVIKHGLLADASLLNLASRSQQDKTIELLRRAIQVKVDVVQQDPYENGIRAHLNLGHTFAHAIEQVSGYKWLHGEAVGVGLVAAARLSRALSLCDDSLPQLVENTITSTGLPRQIASLSAEALYTAMGTDKKWQAGHSRFVLLRAVCQPLIVEDVPKAEVIRILEGLGAA